MKAAEDLHLAGLRGDVSAGTASAIAEEDDGMWFAAFGAVTGGVLSGSFHAVTSPDHLAALLPRCVGVRWYNAITVGALWALGHSVSCVLVAAVAFSLKEVLTLDFDPSATYVDASGRRHANTYAHIIREKLPAAIGVRMLAFLSSAAVGLSLLAIGVLGIREVRTMSTDELTKDARKLQRLSLFAVFANGFFHGFSWDSAPSLAPVFAMESWHEVGEFLCAYSLGTVMCMSIVTAVLGEATVHMAHSLRRPDVPKRLAWLTSLIAIAAGTAWIVKALAQS